MMSQRQTRQISPASQRTLPQLTTRKIWSSEDVASINCVCSAEVSARARFCPYCGRSLNLELTQSATAAISLPTTVSLSLESCTPTGGKQLLTEATTLKEADWVPPLPPKYKESLQSGTAPELVMWEMFKRIIELRSLLEDLTLSLPETFNNCQIEQAQVFLRRHCASCGDPVHRAEGETPICERCESL